jgi:UDP-glucose 4-epimerase
MKEINVEWLRAQRNFVLHEANIARDDLNEISRLLSGPATVFHLAASPGVRCTSGRECDQNVVNNVQGTERLLEWARGQRITKFIYASSSSVYGDVQTLPMRETDSPKPLSVYGMTKLSGERVCQAYWERFGTPIVILRYFTAYGPRQRPDMAFSRFIRALLSDRPIDIFGDGRQARDFCFISDVVDATVRAIHAPAGEILNVASGTMTALADAITVIESLMHRRARPRVRDRSAFDATNTLADISKADSLLGYRPQYTLREGILEQVKWVKESAAMTPEWSTRAVPLPEQSLGC